MAIARHEIIAVILTVVIIHLTILSTIEISAILPQGSRFEGEPSFPFLPSSQACSSSRFLLIMGWISDDSEPEFRRGLQTICIRSGTRQLHDESRTNAGRGTRPPFVCVGPGKPRDDISIDAEPYSNKTTTSSGQRRHVTKTLLDLTPIVG